MERPVKVRESLEVCVEHRTADELIHLIRKLRWMRMDDEAKIMQAQLAVSRSSPGDNVIGGPTDTDWNSPSGADRCGDLILCTQVAAAITQINRRVTCTTSGSWVAIMSSPLFSNTFSMGMFSGKTSAINSLRPAARAMTTRWRIRAAPMPCPWY